MDDAIHALLVLAGAAFSIMVCGASLTFGIICTCRMMGWVPVIAVSYTTINGQETSHD